MLITEFSSSSIFFFHVIYPFDLSVMFFCFHILLQKYFVSFAFGCWFLLVPLTINLLVEFSLVILECPVLFLLLHPVPLSSISSDLFLPVVFSYLLTILFWTFHSIVPLRIFHSLVLSFVVSVSLFVFLGEFTIRTLLFCSGSLGFYLFFHHWLVLLRCKLARLVKWC